MKYIVLIFCSLLIGCVSVPKNEPVLAKPSEDSRKLQSHLVMRFEDLSQVGHYLIRAFDKVENKCSVPPNKIFAAPQIYRSLVDERYSKAQVDYQKKSLNSKINFWDPGCERSCSCDLYVGFSEYMQSLNIFFSKAELKAIEKLKSLQEYEKHEITACVRQASWVCESLVLRDIIKRIDE